MIARDIAQMCRRTAPVFLAFLVATLWILHPAASHAAGLGKLQGRILASDTGEGLSFAEVLLIPADSTAKKIGTHTNSDGTYVLEGPAGRYTLQLRALSYVVKRVEGITLSAGQITPYNTALTFQAIKQMEVVVETRAKKNSDVSMLAVRKKAASVGDAVSAEQVKKSPDKDAGEVLRRVTGLSVSGGKYVFVRGLGERYSSTQIDGVRIASPEQNKRVVPMDLIPATLLENIVVQKTYTADLPGEFGGGDIQVATKNFTGQRTWNLGAGQGFESGVTFHDHATYGNYGGDATGYGARDRRIPAEVEDLTQGKPLFFSTNPARGFSKSTLGAVGRSFENVWSPRATTTAPNASYSATFGDEYKVFGRSLGLIESATFSRGYDVTQESQRFFMDTRDTLYDYAVTRQKESVQLGAISGLSYRLAPRHTLHVRGFYNNTADDEVRSYEGADHNRTESTTGNWLVHRATRLKYVERYVLSGSVEGKHELPFLHNLAVDWKANTSRARQQQPDRREVTYDQHFYDDGNGGLVEYWSLGSNGLREYGDLKEHGNGRTVKAALPLHLAGLGNAKLQAGYDRQSKARDNFYRRFNFHQNANADLTASPDSIFSLASFDGTPNSAWVEEATLAIDNYKATSAVTAGFVTLDLPFGAHARANLGARREHGVQNVKTFDLFHPEVVIKEGRLDNTDWLPAGNLTLELSKATNVRLAASRTLSRPDLNELSPSPSLEYVGGFQVAGNPDLERARIDNYDVRVEAFPSLSEVFAVGCFYKDLHQPIEQVIQAGAPPVLVPRNSDRGHNFGVELEARTVLQRVAPALRHFFLNTNASFISSDVRLTPQLSKLGSAHHPLQGQANYLLNGSLSYSSANGATDVSVLVGVVGKRLRALGLDPLPDVYAQPTTTLDVTLNTVAVKGARLKISGKNLLDPHVRELQGGKEVSSYHDGRRFAVSLSYGS